ncbi:DUF4233 domain-containing protein [Spirillospora sp. NBC_00431]
MSGGTAPNPARRLLAAVLGSEAIVVALAIPVAVTVQDVGAATAGGVCGGVAFACLLVAGLLRFPWAVPVGGVLQVLIIATGFLVPVMFFLGVVFGALWATGIWMGRKAASVGSR